MKMRCGRYKRYQAFLGGVVIGIFLFSGCASSSLMNNLSKFPSDSRELKKKIWLAEFDNETFYTGHPSTEKMKPAIKKYLKNNCSSLLLVEPGEVGFEGPNIKLARTPAQNIDNSSVARIGRRFGLNAVAYVVLKDLDPHQEDFKALGLSKTFYKVKLLIAIQVWDTETGAKIIESYLEPEVDLTETEYTNITQKSDQVVKSLDEELKDAVSDIGYAICNATEEQDWMGYIVDVTDNRVTISSGEEVHIKQGDLFDVFAEGALLRGPSEYQFRAPGVKIGTIKVVRVLPGRAEAEVVSGKGFAVGCTLKPKSSNL